MKWVLVALIVLALAWLALPRPELNNGISYSRTVYDQNGKLLRLGLSTDEKYRIRVELKDITPQIIEAVLLQEDQHFFAHPGFNPLSLVRATWSTFVRHERMGGSTLTMQVARLRYGLYTRTFTGKIKQIWNALLLERYYSKRTILEAYFNLAPMGRNIEGVGAASLIYFGKPASELSPLECLTLAVIPQRPVHFSPKEVGGNISAKELITQRKRLWERWVLKQPSLSSVKSQLDLPFEVDTPRNLPFLAPHFVDYVLKKNPSFLRIESSLDLRLQRLLEKRLELWIEKKSREGLRNAATLLLDYRSMEVRALVGSANFFDDSIDGQVNGTTAKRSPGSTLKPFIYGLAMDQGIIHPQTVLKDSQLQFAEFDPENFDHDFLGPISAQNALVRSRNVPAVFLASKLEKPGLYEFLRSSGIQFPQNERYYGLALALGGAEVSMLELVKLYALFGNQGRLRDISFLKNHSNDEGRQLLSPEATYLVREILADNPMPSAENYQRLSQSTNHIAWKTGTSFGFRDAWTIGVLGPYVLAVWVGNFNGAPNPGLVGRDAAAPLFFEIADALKATESLPSVIETFPKDLTQVKVCAISGKIPGHHCPRTINAWFIAGKSPIHTCDVHRSVWINTRTNKRSCVPGAAFTREEVFEFWPSDILRLFRIAGIPRRVPPPEEPNCDLDSNQFLGRAPEITSPNASLLYQLRVNDLEKQTLPLIAIVDADAHELHWFLDEKYLGKAKPTETFFWKATPGNHVVRVVDNNGRSAASLVRVGVQQ